MEIWKDIEGYEGYYQVSNEGRVKSLERHVVMRTRWGKICMRNVKEKIMTQHDSGKGYLQVFFTKDVYFVHQLVAKAFIPNPHNYSDVHHINQNHQDNRVENLMWMGEHEHKTMHAKERAKKLSKRVDQIDKFTGEVLRQWESTAEAAKQLGYENIHISECARGKRKTAYGSVWKYVSEQ